MAAKKKTSAQRSTQSLLLASFATIIPQLLSVSWRSRINEQAPEPYLDEVFHIRQAQQYCAGNFHIWDDKITTPPGLYLVSYLWHQATGNCSINALRAVNSTSIAVIAVAAGIIISQIHPGSYSPSVRAHTACNIALFPPLFFFSGLYYTDVLSTLLVLLHYSLTLYYIKRKSFGFVGGFASVAVGVAALFFRQTNIFWVAIFPAGLVAVYGLSDDTKNGSAPSLATSSMADYLPSGKSAGNIHNPPASDAYVEDYIKVALTTLACISAKPARAVQVLAPYVLLLLGFTGFVVWNGGVVLGDKSNHIATLHFPQMLYLWPYVVFFSMPLVAVYTGVVLWSQYPLAILPRLVPVFGAMLLGLAAVHFNTIVHPFTLADNRHYVFYVFRILMRAPSIKYLAVPIYVACAWLALRLLGSWGFAVPAKQASQKSKDDKADSSRTHTLGNGQQAGFILVWSAASALSTVTAPLVEPRYFIIPWALWRLNVALPIEKTAGRAVTSEVQASTGQLHIALALETIWMLLINAVTGYLFLYRGFEWPQEPGNVQRFMW